MQALFTCPCCEHVFPASTLGQVKFNCERCHESVEKLIFPAIVAKPEIPESAPLLTQSSTCFYHEQKGAKAICSCCGVFVCALCETEMQGKIYCIRCFEKGVLNEKEPVFTRSAVLYDNVALALALLPFTMVALWFTPLTAPAAIAVCFYYRNKSKSVLPQKKWRWWVALFLAIGQIGLMGFLVLK